MKSERSVSIAERQWLELLPKVELHVHLEGAIPLNSLWELIQKYGGDPTTPNKQALLRKLGYRDFRHFLDVWTWKNGFLREYDDFTFIAEAAARDFVGQNIRYVEAFFSPGDFAEHGLVSQALAEAIRKGLKRVPEVEVALVADLIRDFGPERGALTLAEINEVRDQGVIGIGIGGSENKVPPDVFRDVYEKARRLGLRTSAHAGEAAGAQSVWGAIRALDVDRIGHGTRAVEDESLVEYLAERQIPVELCPLSNVRTGVVDSIEQHPTKNYLDRGLLVCVNTDDPKMFHNTLADEFTELMRHQFLSRHDVRRLVVNGIEASWMPNESKQETIDHFRSDPIWYAS